MNDMEKLKHLLEHWSEHNAEHAKTYLEWSKKAESLGKKEISEILNELAEGTLNLEGLFKKARGLL